MAQAHVVSTGAQGAAPVSSVTTAGVDTTGANLLVVTYTRFGDQAAAATPISDSKGNTWTAATAEQSNSIVPPDNALVRQFYAINPTVGTAHTFTFTLVGAGFPSIGVSAFSGMATTAPLDKTASGQDNTTPYASPATATLAQANEVVVGSYVDGTSAEGLAASGAYTAGFVADGTASALCIGHAWKLVSATTAVTSDFTTTANQNSADQVSTYKEAAVFVPYQPWHQRAPVVAQ